MCFFAYVSSLLMLYLQATVFPHLPCFAFLPFLATLCLNKQITTALWLSAIGTLPLDLLASDPMGIHALSCLITTALGHRLRHLFSIESWIQFSLFSGILSCLQIPVLALLLFLFDRRIPFQGKWWIIDWPALTFCDATYCALWFLGPLAIYHLIHKTWTLHWLKKQNSPT